MNLEDLVDENGLQQDEWSLTNPVFGEEDQLKVVGWSLTKTGKKYYILKCKRCSQDSELFGEGYFRSLKGNLIKQKQLPCGCSNKHLWTIEQYYIRCERAADLMDYKFLGFKGDWKKIKTRLNLLCSQHGIWTTASIHSLLAIGQQCPKCNADRTSKDKTKSDLEMIASFFASDSFHPETKFYREPTDTETGRVTGKWYMVCPDCNQTGKTSSLILQRGCRPCGCSPNRQREAYINWVVDQDNNILAIKFGVSNNSNKRVKQQNHKSRFKIVQFTVYEFKDIESCRKSEAQCKKKLDCGVILKKDMPDGYTETTFTHNLLHIIEIYKSFGGVERL